MYKKNRLNEKNKSHRAGSSNCTIDSIGEAYEKNIFDFTGNINYDVGNDFEVIFGDDLSFTIPLYDDDIVWQRLCNCFQELPTASYLCDVVLDD
jgi:hypothetical protein